MTQNVVPEDSDTAEENKEAPLLERREFRMKKFHIIIVLLFFTFPSWGGTGKGIPSLSTEQEQQFTYYWYAARQAIEESRYADAYVMLEFCRSIQPKDASVLYYLGLIHKGLGDMPQANRYFKLAYEQSPNDYWQEYLKAEQSQAIQDKDWDRVLLVQDEIDKHEPYDAYSAYLRYNILSAQGKYKKALAAIDRYLETDPDNIRFLLLRLEMLEKMKAKPKTLYALYDRILEINPYHLMVLNNYAYHLATHKGDLKEAERMSAITIREEPDNPVYLDTYGWILHLQGQDELALFYLNRAKWNSGSDEVKEEIIKHLNAIK